MNNKIIEVKERAIVILYENGFTFKEVREAVEVGASTITRVLKENNVQVKAKNDVRISEKEMIELEQRIAGGEFKYKIAEDLGITPSALSKRLSRRKG